MNMNKWYWRTKYFQLMVSICLMMVYDIVMIIPTSSSSHVWPMLIQSLFHVRRYPTLGAGPCRSESSVSCNMASPKALETDALQHLKPIGWCRSPKPSSRCPQHWCAPGQDYTLYHCIDWHVCCTVSYNDMTHDWLNLVNVARIEFFVPWVLSPFFCPARFFMLSMP